MPTPESNGGNGGYSLPDENKDITIDDSISKGSGGGGGGTSGLITGGGGGGGAGGGAVILIAEESISVEGRITTLGAGGGEGGLETDGGWTGRGGHGGGGAGGGILLTGANVTVSGSLDARGRQNDTLSEKNGGTVKIFYTHKQVSGSVLSGRTYTNGRPIMQRLLSPANDSGTVDIPLFRWNPANDPDKDAISYQLQIANDSWFESLWIELSNISDTQSISPIPLSGKDLYWRVRARDHFDYGPWSETRRFTIDTVPPVSQVAPMPRYVNWTDLNVTWNGTDDQTGIANFSIFVSDNGAGYRVWQNGTNRTYAIFPGKDGYTYRFYSLAVDRARNREPLKLAPDATVTIDLMPPESSMSPLARYQTASNFTVGWTGADETSGVAGYDVYVSENEGPFEPWLENCTQTSAAFHGLDGHKYTYFVFAYDNAGNMEERPLSDRFVTTRVDGTAPGTVLTIGNPRYGQEPVYVSAATAFQLRGTDNYAGVNRTGYIIDERPAREYEGPFVEAEPGPHNITFWSVDDAGNGEAHRTVWFFVDDEAPATSLVCLGPNYTFDGRLFVSGETRIGFDILENGSGTSRTEYRLDGAGASGYSGPFPPGNRGSHVLIFHSVDNLGNAEAERNRTIIVDLWPPATVARASSTISRTDISVTFNASDTDSGVARVLYRYYRKGWADGDFQPGGTIKVPAAADHSNDGIYVLEYYSVDNVGNRETVRSLEVTIDTACFLELKLKNDTTVETGSFVLAGTAERDALVLVNDRPAAVTSGGNFSFEIALKEGRNRIVVTATDLAGNTATETRYVTCKTSAAGMNWLVPALAMVIGIVLAIALIVWVKRRTRTGPELEEF